MANKKLKIRWNDEPSITLGGVGLYGIEVKVEKKTATRWQKAYDEWIIAQSEIAEACGLGRIFGVELWR